MIALLPLLVSLPQLIGLLHANPMVYVGNLGQNFQAGWLPGVPYADPNVGFTTQALGRLAVDQWLHVTIPWWNSYNGVGVPLAAEYQSAVFSPVTLLLLLPDGIVWRHLLLQIIAGWGSFGLFRQLGLTQVACLCGGLLFVQNGTFAWFADAPAGPVAFLPWLLFGLERVAVQATYRQQHGWRLLAIATGLMLAAGFPETAYLGGVCAFVWAIIGLTNIPIACRLQTIG